MKFHKPLVKPRRDYSEFIDKILPSLFGKKSTDNNSKQNPGGPNEKEDRRLS